MSRAPAQTSLADLEEGELAAAVSAWRARMRDHAESHPCVQLIVNEGGGAGASLEHSHAQLYALDFVPVLIARERERFTAYNQGTMGGDLLADIASRGGSPARAPGRDRRRGDGDLPLGLALAVRAARDPARGRPPIRGRTAMSGWAPFAPPSAPSAQRFGEALELNLWVRTAPRDADVFHWHIDIAPRLAIKAGFEFATGVDINIFPPERAAAELRDSLGRARVSR